MFTKSQKVLEIALPRDNRLQYYHLRKFIEDTNKYYCLPIDFIVKDNYLIVFNLYHRQDYCNFEFRICHESQATVIYVYMTGHSYQLKKKALSDSSKDYLNKSYWGSQIGLENSSEMLFRSTVNSFRSLGYDEQKLEEEEDYYRSFLALVKKTFNVD
ncbi:MAG: hypothetical protein K6F76_06020 [Clostridiales bacterium]|nr:hypothetical protein [Clostridiales bacterium]